MPSAACDRLLELLRAAGEAAEKQKMSHEHNRVQRRAGLGTYRVALNTHVRGVGSECSHTNLAVGCLLLQPTGGVKM